MINTSINSLGGAVAFVMVLALALPLAAVQVVHGEPEHVDETGHSEDVVRLSDDELKEFGIELAVAGPGTLLVTRTLPAEVRFNEDLVAHIVPRYEGIVTKVLAKIGDQVTAGDVLAVIESDESLAPYEITTSIDGTIVDKHMTRGEPVSRENFGFTVVDLSSVWIDITVYLRDIERIAVGERVTVRAQSGGHVETGVITYVTPVVDVHTRTATARMVVDNEHRFWRPGMFAMAEVVTGSYPVAVAVPATSVMSLAGETVIFVANAEGFVPVRVDVGHQSGTEVEIRSGLRPGARYVAVGGFTLKAELTKEAFGEGHGH